MIDINAFVQKWSGQDCKTGPFDDQCVNLVREWCAENGWPMTLGNAIDYAKGEPGWTFTANDPNNTNQFPQAGSIAVFTVGQYGHVALVLPGTTGHILVTLEQNDPLGSVTHVHTYNYLNPKCLGWLTHSGSAAPAPSAPSYSIYFVRAGDNLTSICAAHYHLSDSQAYSKALEIAKYNGLANANAIKVGQSIKLP